MRVVIAPDKFAGSLTALQAAEAMAAGWRRERPADQLDLCPVADGGAGFLETLAASLPGSLRPVEVTDPIGRPVEAAYLLTADGTAVIEAATAVGLHLLAPDERDPTRTTSYGVGELVRAALDDGATTLLVGVGGTATNDGGAGFAMALGARLWDRHDFPVAPEPREMVRLARADLSAMDGRLDGVTTVLASDVDNPLLGRHGASAVYGPQKGATPEMLPLLDKAVGKWRDALARERPGAMDLAAAPGAGAAGGLGFALMLLAGAQMRPGIELVIELTGLRQRVASADLVMTGEGRLDGQSLRGKAPAGIAALALEHGIPCVAIAGQVAVGRRELGAAGLSAAYALTELAPSADVAIQRAGHYAAETAGRVAREWSRA